MADFDLLNQFSLKPKLGEVRMSQSVYSRIKLGETWPALDDFMRMAVFGEFDVVVVGGMASDRVEVIPNDVSQRLTIMLDEPGPDPDDLAHLEELAERIEIANFREQLLELQQDDES